MTDVYICIAKRLLSTPSVHFHLLVDWLTCVIVVQLKEFMQAGSGGSSHSPLPEPVLSSDYSEQQEQQ